jgi:hypothetical protein
MQEELGKIEKPPVKEFQGGRKLFFVPFLFPNKEAPEEFKGKYNRYWEQVESQIANLEMKLGPVKRIYHELVPESGEKGIDILKQLSPDSLNIVLSRTGKGAVLEAVEDNEIMTELMDWSRSLSIGLQSQKVLSTIYGFYTEANNKRNEHIAKNINATLKENEIGILLMAEGHHVRFPADVGIFYIAPPALDEIKRWIRDYEAKAREHSAPGPEPPEETGEQQEKPAGS